MKPTAPCLGCKERHGGCWTNCEKYLHFKTDNETRKAKIKKARDAEKLLDGYTNTQYCRTAGIKEKMR